MLLLSTCGRAPPPEYPWKLPWFKIGLPVPSCWAEMVPACLKGPFRSLRQDKGLCVCPRAPVSSPCTHTVHMPVMENADRLTGRRIQAVMREGSQGGGDVGGGPEVGGEEGAGPATWR